MGNRVTLWDIVWDILAEEGYLAGSSQSRHHSEVAQAIATTA